MSTRKSLAWSFSQQIGQYVLQFIGSIVIARLLTPHEVGVFALAMAANFLISSLRDFGVGSYLVREETINDDKIRTAFGIWITISWLLGLIILTVRHPVADLYDTPGIAEVLTLVSVSFFVTPLGQPAHALLTRELRFDLLHHINLTSVVITVATNIALAFAGFSYMALAWGMVAGTVSRSTLLIIVHPNHLWMLPTFRYWRDVLSFGGWVTATSIVGTVTAEGNKFIIGGLINPAALALFERALQLPTALRMGIARPLSRVLFPAYARMFREKSRLDASFLKVASLTNVLIWPPLFVLGFISVPVVVFIFGEQWRVAGEIMPYVIATRIALTLVPNPQEILTASGNVKKLFAISTIIMILGLSTTAVAASYSLTAVVIVAFLSSIIVAAIHFYALIPIVDFSKSKLAVIHFRSLVIAAITSLPAAAAYLTYGADVPLEIMLVVVPASAAFWFAGVFVLRHEILKELAVVLAQARKSLASAVGRSD